MESNPESSGWVERTSERVSCRKLPFNGATKERAAPAPDIGGMFKV